MKSPRFQSRVNINNIGTQISGSAKIPFSTLLTKGRYVKAVLAVAPVVGTAEAPEDRLDDRLQDNVQHDNQDNAQQIIHIVKFLG